MSFLIDLLPVLLPVAGGITAIFKSIRFVQEGELGVKLRFGRVMRDKEDKPKIYEPGFVLMIPFVEKLQRHHVRQQTIPLGNQRIIIKEGLIFIVDAVVIFRVTDIYKALFEINELDSSITDLSKGVLRDEISARSHEELTDTEEISTRLLGKLKQNAEEWGVKFIQFKLIDCAPSPETAHLLNAEIGAALKMAALKKVSEEHGISLEDLPASLAAVLVGIPLVASVESKTNVRVIQKATTNKESEE
ncbi:MAG: SPFH domain-containing protein [Candidatus Taylorbacteria bacterium]|nr:SPFH domain-containing protein [Candidatus Taylorbacteria bacterium]